VSRIQRRRRRRRRRRRAFVVVGKDLGRHKCMWMLKERWRIHRHPAIITSSSIHWREREREE
jgi:hypothetical protein